MSEPRALDFVRVASVAGIALAMLASRVLASWGRHGDARDVAELAVVPALLLGLTWLLDLIRGDGGPDAHA